MVDKVWWDKDQDQTISDRIRSNVAGSEMEIKEDRLSNFHRVPGYVQQPQSGFIYSITRVSETEAAWKTEKTTRQKWGKVYLQSRKVLFIFLFPWSGIPINISSNFCHCCLILLYNHFSYDHLNLLHINISFGQ